jgi:tRNA (guanine-N7-)-methyltransferase
MPRPATSASIFGNDCPLELEVGSGKGTFLISEAKLRPEVNFLGIEYARRYWRFAADRLRRNDCENARVVLTEVAVFLRDFVPDESLSDVHVYFPDPWPKTRHHKRRLIQPPLVALVARKLKPAARLQIATDHTEYFAQIREVLDASALETVSFRPPASARDSELVGSNFERKYQREGRTIYNIAVEKPRLGTYS